MKQEISLKKRIKDLFSIKKVKSLMFYAFLMGLLINYSLWGIFGVKFSLITFPAYGVFLFLLKSEFIYIFRWCFHKIPGIPE